VIQAICAKFDENFQRRNQHSANPRKQTRCGDRFISRSTVGIQALSKSQTLPLRHRFCFAGTWISLRLRKRQTGEAENSAGYPREQHMFRKVSLALAATLIMAGAAWADPIEGNWKTQAGDTAAISGSGSFSITLKSGKYAGKTIGSLKAAGDNKYAGSITDPANDKTYSGKATLSGTSLKMSGCVLGGLICKSQTWHKL
jgi:uncharacterized protein (DUF2147 family)